MSQWINESMNQWSQRRDEKNQCIIWHKEEMEQNPTHSQNKHNEKENEYFLHIRLSFPNKHTHIAMKALKRLNQNRFPHIQRERIKLVKHITTPHSLRPITHSELTNVTINPIFVASLNTPTKDHVCTGIRPINPEHWYDVDLHAWPCGKGTSRTSTIDDCFFKLERNTAFIAAKGGVSACLKSTTSAVMEKKWSS